MDQGYDEGIRSFQPTILIALPAEDNRVPEGDIDRGRLCLPVIDSGDNVLIGGDIIGRARPVLKRRVVEPGLIRQAVDDVVCVPVLRTEINDGLLQPGVPAGWRGLKSLVGPRSSSCSSRAPSSTSRSRAFM